MKEEIVYEFLYGEPFSTRDFSAVCRLLKQLSPQMSELTKERYIESTANGWVVVARIPNGRIVGLASIIKITKLTRVAYSIEDVIVDEKYRGHGIGKGITQKLIWLAEQTGMERLDLHTSRPIAARLYEKLGFKSRLSATYRLELKQ